MNRLGALFVFALVLLVCGSADARVGREKLPIIKVVKSDVQPEVTAIAQGGVFAQFASFDLNIAGGKGVCELNNIRVEIYSDGKFGAENAPMIRQIFKSIHLIANTSRGNSEATEKTIISSLAIGDDAGISVNLQMEHSFGDGAKFTVIAIPRDDAFLNYNGKTIGLALTSVEVSKDGKPVKVIVRKAVMGIEQRIDQNAYAGSVYMGTTTLYGDGNIYRCLYVYATHDVVVKKALFRNYSNKDTVVSAMYYGASKDYSCLTDKDNNVSAFNFYKHKIELSAEDDGILLPAGYWAYFYSKNDSLLLSHLVDPNDIVFVGAMNYRYAPINIGEGQACFLKGTKVKMSDGKEKDIEKVQVGESVWTVLFKDGRIICGSSNGERTVKTVPDQMFFTVDEDGVNVMQFASLVRVGDWIRNDGCGLSKVTSVTKPKIENVSTYDFVLESGDSYYAEGLKVHSVIEKKD